MEKSLIESKIIEIINKYASVQAPTLDKPLTLAPYSMDVRELTSVFLDIEKEFGADINKMFDEPIDFSISSLANAVEMQVG